MVRYEIRWSDMKSDGQIWNPMVTYHIPWPDIKSDSQISNPMVRYSNILVRYQIRWSAIKSDGQISNPTVRYQIRWSDIKSDGQISNPMVPLSAFTGLAIKGKRRKRRGKRRMSCVSLNGTMNIIALPLRGSNNMYIIWSSALRLRWKALYKSRYFIIIITIYYGTYKIIVYGFPIMCNVIDLTLTIKCYYGTNNCIQTSNIATECCVSLNGTMNVIVENIFVYQYRLHIVYFKHFIFIFIVCNFFFSFWVNQPVYTSYNCVYYQLLIIFMPLAQVGTNTFSLNLITCIDKIKNPPNLFLKFGVKFWYFYK